MYKQTVAAIAIVLASAVPQAQQQIARAAGVPPPDSVFGFAPGADYKLATYDQSIEYLLKANQLKPTDYQTVVTLGLVNLDAGHYDQAEKWYRAALKMKSDDVMVLAGLADATLKKGDAKAAEEAIAKLEKVDPNAEDLPQFRTKLASLKAGK